MFLLFYIARKIKKKKNVCFLNPFGPSEFFKISSEKLCWTKIERKNRKSNDFQQFFNFCCFFCIICFVALLYRGYFYFLNSDTFEKIFVCIFYKKIAFRDLLAILSEIYFYFVNFGVFRKLNKQPFQRNQFQCQEVIPRVELTENTLKSDNLLFFGNFFDE